MKINLVIEADTPEELRKACRALGGSETVYHFAPGEHIFTNAESPDADTPSTLITGEPDNPYGDGNGPVDDVKRAEPQPEPEPASETPTAPERDAAGLPWDERIHAGSKALNADGTWRKRRGVDDETVAAVEAELRGGDESAPEPVAESTQHPEAVEQQPEPDATPTPDTTPSEPTPQPSAERTYTAQDVMKVIGSAMSSGSRAPEYVSELCHEAGISSPVDIFSNAEALAVIVAKLRKDGVISDV